MQNLDDMWPLLKSELVALRLPSKYNGDYDTFFNKK